MAQDRGIARPELPPVRNVQFTAMAFHRRNSSQHYEAGQMQNPPLALGLGDGRHFPQYNAPLQPTADERGAVQPMEQKNRSAAPDTGTIPEFKSTAESTIANTCSRV